MLRVATSSEMETTGYELLTASLSLRIHEVLAKILNVFVNEAKALCKC